MTDLLLTKIPPHDLDMEESILSALFMSNSGFSKIEELLPEDFYKGSHKKIFSIMLELRKENLPVDLMTVAERLSRKDELESVGGAAYLAMISETAPIAVNIYAYAKAVKDLALVRNAILACCEIMEEGFKTQKPEEFVDNAQRTILSLQTTSVKDKFTTLSDLMIDTIKNINTAQTKKEGFGLNFGMPSLSNAMFIHGSKLIIIAARPGVGKTALMLSESRFLAQMGIKNGVLSIEMDKEALGDRLLSVDSNINSLKFYNKNTLDDSDLSNLEISASGLSGLPILIDDEKCNIQDVKRKCRKMKKEGCQIIFIDQLSKISFDKKLSDYQGYSRNCSEIAELKKELRIPIVLLCQINRNVETRNNKRPTLADLKQTGQIEEDADMIFFIYREWLYDKQIDPSRTEIELAKNRNGAVGVEHHVLFNSRRAMFSLII